MACEPGNAQSHLSRKAKASRHQYNASWSHPTSAVTHARKHAMPPISRTPDVGIPRGHLWSMQSPQTRDLDDHKFLQCKRNKKELKWQLQLLSMPTDMSVMSPIDTGGPHSTVARRRCAVRLCTLAGRPIVPHPQASVAKEVGVPPSEKTLLIAYMTYSHEQAGKSMPLAVPGFGIGNGVVPMWDARRCGEPLYTGAILYTAKHISHSVTST